MDVLPKIYSDEEGEDSFPRADKTNKDVSKQPKDSENISFEKKNSRQEIDITEYHSNIERRDETDTEETTPKRVCSPLDQLPVDMTSEHLHPIDINVIVSQDIDRSHRPVLQDGDAENPDEENAFIYPRDSTDETSRRNFGTFSAGADEVNLYKGETEKQDVCRIISLLSLLLLNVLFTNYLPELCECNESKCTRK